MKKTTKLLAFGLCLTGLLLGLTACVEKQAADLGDDAPVSSSASSGAGSSASGEDESDVGIGDSQAESKPVSGASFQWLGYNTSITLYSEDPEEVGNRSESAAGRYVGIRLETDGEGFLYDTVSTAYSEVELKDEGGNSYLPGSRSITLPEGANFRDMTGVIFPDVTLVYDIPTEVPLDTLTLYIPEGDVIPMADYL